MIVVGLTGGIATGKSIVLETAGEFEGVLIIDADQLAWTIYERGKPAYNEIIDQFGQEIIDDERAIDRKMLGSIVFSDHEKLEKLEKIVHPRVMDELRKIKRDKKGNNKLMLVEGARIVQSKYVDQSFFDFIILIQVDKWTQISRLKKRNGIDEREARRLIGIQNYSESIKNKADFIINSRGRIEDTKRRTRELFIRLLDDI